MTDIIINADDFGISAGVNAAIELMHQKGTLNSASILVNGSYFQNAVEFCLQNKNFKTGLHFNLTTGKSILHPISIPLLVNNNGIFKNGFLGLVKLSIFKRKQFLGQVEAELKAQFEFLKAQNIDIKHINGHRHIHYIFGIFSLVAKLAEKNNLQVRVINEHFFDAFRVSLFPPISGLIKWFVIKFLGFFNGSRKIKTSRYFFSIIYSCQIKPTIANKIKIPEKYNSIEIMLHPSIIEKDKGKFLEYEKNHLTSINRSHELNFKFTKYD